MRKVLMISSLIVLLASCVPIKQYSNLKDDYKNLGESEALYLEESRLLKEANAEMTAGYEKLKTDNDAFNEKYNTCSAEKTQLEEELNRLKKSYEEFPDMNKMNNKEITNLLKKVRDANLELIERERKLSESEKIRREEQKRLLELEDALKKKDAAVADLKRKVSDALLGFEKDGLSVKIKNGKVYVSVEDKLLFKSASWNVGENGKSALRKLANVIAKNEDINIMVEGHTDNIPYRGNKHIKDNWDLSVKRSTAIIRIILENKAVNPKRLIAAGRSKYVPLSTENTSYARSKNRRTEIILTPKLDEVFKILEN
jgi:chemotaxis protein MotB